MNVRTPVAKLPSMEYISISKTFSHLLSITHKGSEEFGLSSVVEKNQHDKTSSERDSDEWVPDDPLATPPMRKKVKKVTRQKKTRNKIKSFAETNENVNENVDGANSSKRQSLIPLIKGDFSSDTEDAKRYQLNSQEISKAITQPATFRFIARYN